MIYLVRHGQTAFNAEGRFQGNADSPLTALGFAQAEEMGKLLGGLVAGLAVTLWSSPLGRARRTAEIIGARLGLREPIRFDPRLREVSFGCWDGLTDLDIEEQHPGLRDGSTRYDWFFRSPDGESVEAVEQRMRSWLEETAAIPGCHIAVSHGLAGRLLRGVYLGLDRAVALELDIPQDAVFRLEGGVCDRMMVGATYARRG